MKKEMTKKYYKILSLLTLIGSVSYYFILNESYDYSFKEVILLNAAFHFMFYAMSNMPYEMYKQIVKNSYKIKGVAFKLVNVFSLAVMLMISIGSVLFLIGVFNDGRYERLIFLFIFSGIFLGSYISYLKLHNKYLE